MTSALEPGTPPAPDVPPVLAEAWDPFQLMDRLDEDAFRRELEGVPSSELVYVVKEGQNEVVGLSKAGVDACCLALVSQGQVIREEDLRYEVIGEGEEREALFQVRAARFAVKADGTEVRLDAVIGVKRQALYFEQQALSLDARVPSKKFRGMTYRQLLEHAEGRSYLEWMAGNFNEAEIRDFVTRILAGEDVAVARGMQFNPHWYEAGAMKAARNARFRLIPGKVRQDIIAHARASGQAREIAPESRQPARPQLVRNAPAPAPREETAAPRTPEGPYAPTEKQVAFFHRLADSPCFTDEERRAAYEWLARKATRQTIKDQLDWLKRQVETRRGHGSTDHA